MVPYLVDYAILHKLTGTKLAFLVPKLPASSQTNAKVSVWYDVRRRRRVVLSFLDH
jgi:hypothetical protein